MTNKINIRNSSNDGWINLLQSKFIEVGDTADKFVGDNVETVLEEIYDKKADAVSSTIDPTTSDTGYNEGSLWINTVNKNGFICMDKVNGIWQSVYAGPVVAISESTLVESGKCYTIDSSVGGVIITLPANPVYGDTIEFFPSSSWSLHNFSISGNNKNIQGSAVVLDVDISNGFKLVYSIPTWGWAVV